MRKVFVVSMWGERVRIKITSDLFFIVQTVSLILFEFLKLSSDEQNLKACKATVPKLICHENSVVTFPADSFTPMYSVQNLFSWHCPFKSKCLIF